MAITAVTAGALALTGCSSSSGGGGGGSTGSSSPSAGGLGGGGGNSGGGSASQTYKLGFIGALSGPNAQLGINERNGMELAIDQAMSSGKYNFKVVMDAQDSEGDPRSE